MNEDFPDFDNFIPDPNNIPVYLDVSNISHKILRKFCDFFFVKFLNFWHLA